MSEQPFRDQFVAAADGLKLHLRDYGEATDCIPVLCLPGLTRTVADFDTIAPALAFDRQTPRRVIALDSRGRGLSDHDPSGASYTLPAEAQDVLAVLDHLGIARVAVIGTSRGGLLALTLAAMKKDVLAGVVLNDVGPVLDIEGLLHIKAYAGKIARPSTWREAALNHEAMFRRDFPKLDDAGWMAWAKRAWKEDGGRFVPTHDPRVADGIRAIERDTPPPPLWDLYDLLADVPVMVVRGALSDLLSRQTVAEMKARRPDLVSIEVADEGHAPLLTDAPTIAVIADFLRRCDGTAAAAC